MDRDELGVWLRLTLTPGVGNETARKLLAAFGLPDNIFRQSVSALLQVVSANQAAAIKLEPPGLDALLASLRASGIAAETKAEWDSPETGKFARVHDPEGNPIELWEVPV